MLQSLKIIVSGKVQGVYYRQSTYKKAKQLEITGTVKNLDTGDVEIIATGTSEQLQQLADWCKQGPPQSHVTNVFITQLSLQSFTDFSITK